MTQETKDDAAKWFKLLSGPVISTGILLLAIGVWKTDIERDNTDLKKELQQTQGQIAKIETNAISRLEFDNYRATTALELARREKWSLAQDATTTKVLTTLERIEADIGYIRKDMDKSVQ